MATAIIRPMSEQRGNWWKRVRRPVFLALGGYVGIMILMMFLENSLIFFPTQSGPVTPPFADVEDAWFTAADGQKIHGWYFQHPDPQAVILFAHGNAGNLVGRGSTMNHLRDVAQASVLIFDYRGYGQSEGKPNEQGILLDARAARAWLANRAGVREDEITLMGRSLGSGVMVDLAAADGANGLILESAFTSLPDTAANHYPWLPVRWLMRTRLDSASKIKNYTGPLLMSHGDEDSVVPYRLGQRLFELAPTTEKTFVTIPGGDHNNPQSAEYYDALHEFVAAVSLRPEAE